MTLQIVDVEQNTPDWDELRALRLGASSAQAIAACGAGLKTLCRSKVREYVRIGEPGKERYYGSAMQNGNEQEDTAAMLYEFKTGRSAEKVGYGIHSAHIGASPDRLVDIDGMIEIKCPCEKVYFDLLIDKKIETKYLWQMQMQMLVFGRAWCDYVVYCPHIIPNLFIERVYPDQKKFNKLEKGFIEGSKQIKVLLQMFSETS